MAHLVNRPKGSTSRTPPATARRSSYNVSKSPAYLCNKSAPPRPTSAYQAPSSSSIASATPTGSAHGAPHLLLSKWALTPMRIAPSWGTAAKAYVPAGKLMVMSARATCQADAPIWMRCSCAAPCNKGWTLNGRDAWSKIPSRHPSPGPSTRDLRRAGSRMKGACEAVRSTAACSSSVRAVNPETTDRRSNSDAFVSDLSSIPGRGGARPNSWTFDASATDSATGTAHAQLDTCDPVVKNSAFFKWVPSVASVNNDASMGVPMKVAATVPLISLTFCITNDTKPCLARSDSAKGRGAPPSAILLTSCRAFLRSDVWAKGKLAKEPGRSNPVASLAPCDHKATAPSLRSPTTNNVILSNESTRAFSRCSLNRSVTSRKQTTHDNSTFHRPLNLWRATISTVRPPSTSTATVTVRCVGRPLDWTQRGTLLRRMP